MKISRKVFLLIAAGMVGLLGAVMFCLSWYDSQRTAAIQRSQDAMTIFAQQVEDSTRNVLQVFATTEKAGSLASLLAVKSTEQFSIRRRSITRAAAGFWSPTRCELGFSGEGEL
jgi:hypothetical protein